MNSWQKYRRSVLQGAERMLLLAVVCMVFALGRGTVAKAWYVRTAISYKPVKGNASQCAMPKHISDIKAYDKVYINIQGKNSTPMKWCGFILYKDGKAYLTYEMDQTGKAASYMKYGPVTLPEGDYALSMGVTLLTSSGDRSYQETRYFYVDKTEDSTSSVRKKRIAVPPEFSKVLKKGGKFRLGAKSMSRLSYRSSNKKVATVSSKGVVTMKGYGKTRITVKNAAGGKTSVKIVLKPKQTKGLKASLTRDRRVLVRWTRNKEVNGYHMQLSSSPLFLNKNTRNGIAKKNTVTSTLLPAIAKNKTHYLRIRGFVNTSSGKVYSDWYGVFSLVVV